MLTISSTAFALPEDQLHCRGDLMVYAVKKDTAKKVNALMEGYSAKSNELDRILVANDPKEPFLEIYPWVGIHHKDYAERYKKELDIAYESDQKTFFKAKVTGKKTGYSAQIVCHLGPEQPWKPTKKSSKK